jgi:elongation factor G
MGGNVPSKYIPAVEKGFSEALEKGTLAGNPISGVRMALRDGAFHAVDLPELAFRLAAISAFREAYLKTKPVILEPIMTVEVVTPIEFQSALCPLFSNMMTELGILGAVIGGLNARRVTIIDSEVCEDEITAVAEVALKDMFGYSSQLRGAMQGQGRVQHGVQGSCFFCVSIDGVVDTMVRVTEPHAGAPECAGRAARSVSRV